MMQAAGSGSRAFLSRSALPSEWDRRHYGRHQHVQEYLKVDGLTVKYVGPGESDTQAATIFADKPVPQDVPLYYFEVTIVNRGDSGYIGVGFCTDAVNLGRLPGWEPHSYGYHGDDGHAFHGSGQGRAFGPGFTSGDVIGALLDRSRRTISYYKNGQSVGVAFYDVQEQQLYPCVGMRTKHEEVRANFGGAPFCVDISKLQADFQARVMCDIAAISLPAVIEVPTPPGASSSSHVTSAGMAAAAAAGGVPGGGGSSSELEAAAAACTEAIRGLDSSSGAALATLETATQAYLAALEAAATASGASLLAGGAGPSSAAAAAAGGSSRAAAQPAGGKASQPLMLYYVFNYLLHRRCWKTAAIIAQEMLAGSGSGASAGGDNTAAGATAGGGVGGGDAGGEAMDCSTGAAQQEDHPMPDAAVAEAPPSASQPAAAAATASTASAAAQVCAFSEADVQDALRRQKIYDAVCAGQIAESLAIVRAQYGAEVLQANPHLHFKLRVQQFVELVRDACNAAAAAAQQPPPLEHQQASAGQGSSSNGAAAAAGAGSAGTSSIGFEAALAYGRSELGPGSKSPQDEELLSDALSLLAYADPAASPCGHLLRDSYRAELAEELNGALLKARGSSGKPLLECVYRQAVVLVDELKRANVPAALVLDVAGMCGGRSSSSGGGGGATGGS